MREKTPSNREIDSTILFDQTKFGLYLYLFNLFGEPNQWEKYDYNPNLAQLKKIPKPISLYADFCHPINIHKIEIYASTNLAWIYSAIKNITTIEMFITKITHM